MSSISLNTVNTVATDIDLEKGEYKQPYNNWQNVEPVKYMPTELKNNWTKSIEDYVICMIYKCKINAWMHIKMIHAHEKWSRRTSRILRGSSFVFGTIGILTTAYIGGEILPIIGSIAHYLNGSFDQYRVYLEDYYDIEKRQTSVNQFGALATDWDRELRLSRKNRQDAIQMVKACCDKYNAILEFAPDIDEETVNLAVEHFKDTGYLKYLPNITGVLQSIEPYNEEVIINVKNVYKEQYVLHDKVAIVPEYILYEKMLGE